MKYLPLCAALATAVLAGIIFYYGTTTCTEKGGEWIIVACMKQELFL